MLATPIADFIASLTSARSGELLQLEPWQQRFVDGQPLRYPTPDELAVRERACEKRALATVVAAAEL